jgi:hypothetical protein
MSRATLLWILAAIILVLVALWIINLAGGSGAGGVR